MGVSTEDIKKLRDETGVSIGLCKKALDEADGDHAKALEILQAQGAASAAKKSKRTLGAGSVAAYIHNTHTIGAMVNLQCETDFVAKNEEFEGLAKDIAMHISAMSPETNEDLLAQPFVKDDSKTVKDMIDSAVQKFGERIEVGQFVRYSAK